MGYESGAKWEAANTHTDGSSRLESAATGKQGKGVQCNGWGDGKVGLSLASDLPQAIPGTKIKSVGCWIYNPGSKDYKVTLFAYKGANRTDAAQLNQFTLKAGEWTYVQSGVVNGGSFKSTDSFYNFQFYMEKVGANLVFDSFCIYM